MSFFKTYFSLNRSVKLKPFLLADDFYVPLSLKNHSKMTTQAIINDIRFQIMFDDLSAPLSQLRQLLKDHPQLDEAIQQSARYNAVLKRIRLGLTDFETADMTTNQIRKGVLDLLNELEHEQEKLNDKEAKLAHAAHLVEEASEYQKIKDKIFINRGVNTSELLKHKQATDLDKEMLSYFFELERVKAYFNKKTFVLKKMTIQERLVRLSLAENGHIFKGTFLCLGQFHQIPSISQTATESKFIVFKGTQRSNMIAFDTVTGNIIQQYERIMFLLRRTIPAGMDRVNNEDIYEIPIAAVREFVTNAFVHHDYSESVQSYIHVELFDDRIEIKSPGQFPDGIDPNNIENNVLINPTIAGVFYLYKYIEKGGTGINTAQKLLQEHGLQPAKIENIDSQKMVKVTIYRKPSTVEEDTFWQQVIAKNTMTMYNRYLRKYPNGKYVDEADKRLDEIENQA